MINKKELERDIISLCWSVALAMMITVATLLYSIAIIAGAGLWWVLILDIIWSALDWYVVSQNWKNIKFTLGRV